VQRLGLAVLAVTLSGCLTELGPDGDWLHYEFADGFCLELKAMGASGQLGHCGEDDDGETTTQEGSTSDSGLP